ncbi:MAG TPA: hypothetical protein VIX61_02090 [Casimicrobiaceae bacterium]
MEKINVERAHAPDGQATLPGFPIPDEERGEQGRGARRRALVDRARAQRACAPMGTLASIVVSRDAHDERRVWYVVDPDPLMAPHYATHGIALEPGCKVLVDAEALRPVALIEIDPADGAEDSDTSTPCGFNPYWDLPPT